MFYIGNSRKHNETRTRLTNPIKGSESNKGHPRKNDRWTNNQTNISIKRHFPLKSFLFLNEYFCSF